MRKQFKNVAGSLLVVGLLITGLTSGATVYAASEIGAAGAAKDTEYTLEEMLVYAIEDEYLAQAEYNVIMDTYGTQKPYSNITRAEATHISLLEPLFAKYSIQLPDKDWKSLVTVPASLDAAYAVGADAEEKKIAMYDSFLKENLSDDVRDVFEKLMNASEKHLAAFQRQVDGNGCVNMNGSGSGRGRNGQSGMGCYSNSGNGNGNRGASQGSCILQ